ncbi:MAG: MerR family DNA-binding transcriptional regulator [Selenomonadaceae bacterium]|nr:MerR family DNA-binding transcriptional regulator [Selenomonadaceae bacterium]
MRIGKIARLTGLMISKLRYYEKHGLNLDDKIEIYKSKLNEVNI